MVDNDLDKQELLKFRESLDPFEQSLIDSLSEELAFKFLFSIRQQQRERERRLRRDLERIRLHDPLPVMINEGGY